MSQIELQNKKMIVIHLGINDAKITVSEIITFTKNLIDEVRYVTPTAVIVIYKS